MDFEQLNQRLQKLSNEVDIRKAKIDFLKENGINPYREDFVRTNTIKETLALDEGAKVKICGRIIFRRIMGKFGFAKIQDIDGMIQVSVGRNEIEESEYDFYKKLVDVGDFIGVEGELYRTQTGELTVRAHKVELLSKAMRPLPEKFHGLTDIEAKYRQRYLDIIMNEKSREIFKARSKIESLIRRYLEDNGFTEIETPVLQKNVSGAAAKPFFTKHNALDLQCNLRIAKETWLKMAMVAGFDRVFELGKDFRNEGMDPTHLQEFTQVEWYASFWRFEDNITFFQELVKKLLKEIIGTLEINYQGNVINFGGEWERIDYVARLREILGFDFMQETDLNEFKKKVVATKLFTSHDLEECKSIRTLIDYIYKRTIREKIVGPTILYNYPAVLKTLARHSDQDYNIAEAFQVVVCGAEICNAFSELVDPEIQRTVLEAQQVEKNQGDDETMDVDEDFLLAMEHGMPPMSGLGFGIDRFVMLIFDLPNIRDGVLFPIMK